MFNFNAPQAPKTVDGVLSAFRNTIAELEAVAVDHATKAVEHARIKAEHEAHEAAALAESVRATCIVAKMQAVFG